MPRIEGLLSSAQEALTLFPLLGVLGHPDLRFIAGSGLTLVLECHTRRFNGIICGAGILLGLLHIRQIPISLFISLASGGKCVMKGWKCYFGAERL